MHTSNTFVSDETTTAWHKLSIIPEQDDLYFMTWYLQDTLNRWQ